MSGIRRHWSELAAVSFGAASVLAALFWRWQIDIFAEFVENNGRTTTDLHVLGYESFLRAEHNWFTDFWFVLMCASLVAMLCAFLIRRDGPVQILRTALLLLSGTFMMLQGLLLALVANSPFLLAAGLITILPAMWGPISRLQLRRRLQGR